MQSSTMLNRLIYCSNLIDKIIEAKCSSKFTQLLSGKVGISVGLIQDLGLDYLV